MKTVEDALEALQSVVAEFGDGYVYPDEYRGDNDACVYVSPEGEPRCIVGHVLDRWGLLCFLKSTAREGGYLNPAIDGLRAGGEISTSAGIVLRAAQVAQDRCLTWGSALIAAKEMARDLQEAGA